MKNRRTFAGGGCRPGSARSSTSGAARDRIVRRRLLDESGHCAYCGVRLTAETMTVDHVHPRSKGGANEHHNRVPACAKCNEAKADRPVFEFLSYSNPEWIPPRPFAELAAPVLHRPPGGGPLLPDERDLAWGWRSE